MIRLAPPFDTPAGLAWAAGLPAAVEAAPAEAVIYRARNTLVRLPGPDGSGEVVVKAFGRGKWWRPGGGPIKAGKSFERALGMIERGIGTPAPVAAVAKNGRGYYACAWVPGCASVWDIHDRKLPEAEAEALARFTARMHAAGVLHRDNTPGNILLAPRPGGGFDHLVVDCNRVAFGPVGVVAGLKNLVMLECQDRLVGPYLAERGADTPGWRRFFALCAAEHRWRWAVKRGSRPLRRKLGF
jgi:hypothetical protein